MRGPAQPFLEWSLDEAAQVLNNSPWTRTQTFTQVVGGIGSGVSGEKEIYSTFYVRFLSARPIREAYTRIQLILHGYDQLPQDGRSWFTELIDSRLDLDFQDWIVVAVAFRSNEPNEESVVRKFFASQTTGTLKNKAFLATETFTQVQMSAYFPPREESVGARFVFPRKIDGVPVAADDQNEIAFEITGVPAVRTAGEGGQGRRRGRYRRSRDEESEENKGILRATFLLSEMVLDGELHY
jgi:hypothetical protein